MSTVAARRAGTALLVAALAWALCAAAASAAAPQAPSLTVQSSDTEAYPEVELRVSLPAELAAKGADPRFSLKENGSAVRDLRVSAVQGESAPALVMLVVDASGSMQGKPLTDARAAAHRFIAALGSNARVALVAISDEPRLLSPYTTDRDALAAAVDSLDASGETALYDSLTRAVALPAPAGVGADARRSIVLLSDGGDTVSDATFDKTMRTLGDSKAQLYAVAIDSDEFNPEALRLLAAGTGGRLLTVGDTASLAPLFEGIATEIANAWTVAYTSSRPRTKDIEIDLTAEVGERSASAALAIPNPLFAGDVTPTGPGAVVPEVGDDPARLAAATLLAFLSAAVLGVGVLLILVKEPNTLGQLKFYDQLHIEADAGTGGMADQVRTRVVDAVGQVAGKRGLLHLVALRLEAAGWPLRPAEYITAHLLFVVVASLVVEFLTSSFPLAIIAVLATTVVPMMLVANAAERRRARFETQLPDVLSMIAGSLRGGWGVGQAIALVVQEAPAPSRDEFRRVDAETRLGLPLERSLQAMADRMDSTDFRAVVTSISIQREVGGNLAEVLDVVANTIRERESLRRQISALTADGRISAYILIGLPFAILTLLLLLSPGYLEPLYTTLFGSILLIGGVLLLIVGSVWMWRVTKIEV